jgi:ribosomal protein L18
MKKNKAWVKAVENALKAKGFTNGAARKTAAATVSKSIAKAKLVAARKEHSVDWKETMNSHRVQISAGAREAQRLHDQAAINKPSTMTGKIVVVPPQHTR